MPASAMSCVPPLPRWSATRRCWTPPGATGTKPSDDRIVGVIRQQSNEVAFLVEDLLVATRMASGEITYSRRKVRLQIEIEAVLAGLPTPEGSTLMVSGSADARAVGDPGRIRQILRNLVSNAHHHGGPKIALHVAESDATITLTVADDGRPPARTSGNRYSTPTTAPTSARDSRTRAVWASRSRAS